MNQLRARLRATDLRLLVSPLTAAAAGFLASVGMARSFGAEGRGAYAVTIVTVMAVGQLLAWGLGDGLAIRLASNGPPRRPRQGVFVVWGVMILAATLVAAVHPNWAVYAVGAVTAAMSLQLGSFALARGHHRVWALTQMSQPILVLAAIVLSAWDGRIQIPFVLGVYVVAPLIGIAAGLRVVPREVPGTRDRSGWMAVLKLGTQRQFSVTIFSLLRRLDILVLSTVAPLSMVGHYAVSVSLIDLCLMAPVALSGVLLRDELAGRRLEGRTVVRRMLLLVTPPVAVLLVTGYFLIPLLWGSEFRSSFGYFAALVPACIALGVGRGVQSWRAGRGEQRLVVRRMLQCTPPAALVIAGGALLGDAYGAAVGSSVAYVLLTGGLLIGHGRARVVAD